MEIAITNDIKVIVETQYEQNYSSPIQHHYVFTYKVTIENNSPYTIQLLRRYWEITDSLGIKKKVEGEGVVGQQPVIEAGDSHQYVSGSNFKTGIGKMLGHYTVERQVDGEQFEIKIPEFSMIVPFRLN